MSVEGVQLPRQRHLQVQTKPIGINQGGAAIYQVQGGGVSNSFMNQQSLGQNLTKDNLDKLQKGTLLAHSLKNIISDGFDATARNSNHPYHSSGVGIQKFNN